MTARKTACRHLSVGLTGAYGSSKRQQHHSWCDLNYELVGEYCEDTCTVTDKLTASLTVDPSSSGRNRVSWTVIYSPDSRNFDGYHFQWFVLKFSSYTECGTDNTESYSTSTSNQFTTNCNSVLWNSKNTTAVEFWGHFVPTDQYVGDQARDGTAQCMPESTDDPVCLY